MLVSSVYEGFSLVMLEANSQGLPVITSNWGDAVYEMIENGKNGYVVEGFLPLNYAKMIHDVINDKEKLNELFNKDNMYHNIMYDSLIFIFFRYVKVKWRFKTV